MTLHWPQITWIILCAVALTINLLEDGKPQPPHSFVRTFVTTALSGLLLWAGGFFG